MKESLRARGIKYIQVAVSVVIKQHDCLLAGEALGHGIFEAGPRPTLRR